MVLTITADHGPAVSGAHNCIVTSRAGKDLISSLCSGLLTIGPRFGGALDESAAQFAGAYDAGISPAQFVKDTRAANKLISARAVCGWRGGGVLRQPRPRPRPSQWASGTASSR